MKKQLNQLRRFFARTGTRKLNAATAREVIPASYDDDDNSNRLSGAFIVVLALHVIALVGVFAFSRMKDPAAKSAGAPGQAPAIAGGTAAEGAPEPRVADGFSAGDPVATPAPAIQPAPPEAKVDDIAAAETAPAAVERAPESSRTASRSGGRVHVVKPGDNLTKIAVAWGTRPADLMAANNLKSDEIRPGQELSIPEAKITRTPTPSTAVKSTAKPAAKTNPDTYKVQKNDTLVKIARELGVSYDDLAKMNGIRDPRKLQEGQVLKVPKKRS